VHTIDNFAPPPEKSSLKYSQQRYSYRPTIIIVNRIRSLSSVLSLSLTYLLGMETIKTTADWLHAAVWLQVKVRDRGLGLWLRLCAGPIGGSNSICIWHMRQLWRL